MKRRASFDESLCAKAVLTPERRMKPVAKSIVYRYSQHGHKLAVVFSFKAEVNPGEVGNGARNSRASYYY
jgi:hypothetical protein